MPCRAFGCMRGRSEYSNDSISCGQHLARQAEVDGALRLRLRNRQRPVDDAFEVDAVAQLVVPLDPLAHHAALVARLLRPVDAAVARALEPALGQRRAAGGEQHRHVVAAGVDQAAGRVGGAGDRVHHDDLRLASHHRVAGGHRHRGDLVRDGHRLRDGQLLLQALGVGVDDGTEVRAAVAEEVIDAARRQKLDVRLGGGFDRNLLHARTPC